MRTLYSKLSITLVLLVALIGGGFFAVEQFSTRLYYEEITQRLNASIAMYVTGERQLIEDGVVNDEALTLLAQQAMVINPTVEVYLLDKEGRILGHAMPPESIQSQQVEMEPVTTLISGSAQMPLRGTDPRNLEREKVFSAHPVEYRGEVQGYLYAILGGQKYDELASSIRGSYIQRLSIGALVAIAVTALVVGLLVFGLMTRRLRRLTSDVRRFTEAGFDFDRPKSILPLSEVQMHYGDHKPVDATKHRERDNDNHPLISAPGTVLVSRDNDHPHSAEVSEFSPLPGTLSAGGDEIQQLREAFDRMASKLNEQYEGLKETDRLRRELVSNVSHDLRTPLSSMHGYVETLLIKNDELTSRERRHYLEITHKHTQRLGQLVGDLFELSKLDSASTPPDLESFNLAELLHDVAQEFELEAQQKGIEIRIKARSSNATVYADIGLLQRVLENLIRNALKYTPQDGNITLGLNPAPGSIAVTVADTGCGIPKKDLTRVFDRFYRSERNDEPESSSAGLGLAIVRRILDLHGSRITVTSEVNQGTCFEFTLATRKAA